jgi:cob(I)alamin adenosyltransferase
LGPYGYDSSMKIYTGGGDDGSTGLYGGARLSKADRRVEAYGAVDEVNAMLGWVRAARPSENIDATLASVQDSSFRLGAWLATQEGRDPGVEALTADDVFELEAAIDGMEEELDPLKTFILPGGSEAASRLHVARTVCRRAERRLVALAAVTTIEPLFIRWINRLSDLLFVQARWENHRAGVADVPWQPRRE